MNSISALAAMAFALFIAPVYGQTSSPCTASMLSSLTPCINFLSNSTANSTSPAPGCCTSLNSLTSGGMDCLCLVINGNVPLPITINRTLAISLPQACNMPGVPVQCKATDAPAPAPGPVSIPQALSPGVTPSVSPPAVPSQLVPPSEAPEADNTPSSVSSESPASTTGSRPVLTPSAAMPSYSFSAYLLFMSLAFATLKIY